MKHKLAPLLLTTLLLAACGGGSGDASGGGVVPPPPGGGGTGQPSLVFIVQPTPQQVNTNLAPAVQIELRDANGARISGGPGSGLQSDTTVSLTISNGPSGGSLQGTTMRTSAIGVATFPDLRLSVPGDYVLRALSPGRPQVDSIQFTITAPGVPPPPPPPPTGPTQLAFVVQPMDTNIGLSFSLAPKVEVRDANGVRVTSAAVTVTLSLEGGPTGTALSGSTTTMTVAGTASFSGLSVNTVSSGYRLRATSQGLTQAVSATFQVFPAAGPPTQLRFMDPIPDAPVRGYIDPVRVEVLDANGVRVTDAQVDVTVELAANPGKLLLRGGTVVNHQDGWIGGWASQMLELWDPDAGQGARTAIGELPAATAPCHALSIDHDNGIAYALQRAGIAGNPWTLSSIDLSETSTPAIVNTSLPQVGIGGIAVDANGDVIVAGLDPTTFGLSRLDPVTGQVQTLGTLSLAAGGITQVLGIAIDPVSGDIFGICSLQGQPNNPANVWLVRFDHATLIGDTVGQLPFAAYCATFASDGTFYVSAVPIPPPAGDIFQNATIPSDRGSGGWPEVYIVDTQTAAVTLVTVSPLEGKTVFAGMPAVLRGVKTRATSAGGAVFEGLALDAARPGYQLGASSPGLASATSSSFEVTPPAAQLPSIRFSTNSQPVNEGNPTATIEIQLSGPSPQEVSAYVILSGEAYGNGVHHSLKAPLDAREMSWLTGLNTVEGLMVISIPPGQTSHTITLTITDDNIAEPDRWLFMRLIRPFGATLGNNTTHALQIIDND